MNNLRKQIRISDDPEVTLKRIDEPRRGTVFFNGPVLAVQIGVGSASWKMDKLAAKVDRLASRVGDISRAATMAAETLIHDADVAYKFFTGKKEGLGPAERAKLLRETAAIIKDYYEQEY